MNNHAPQRINRNAVRAQLERGITWRGYLAGDYIVGSHIIEGWALGFYCELNSIAELEEKSAAILLYLDPELGRRIATWSAPASPETITRYNGRAWRNGEPLRHDGQTTIADVLAYEIVDLGNKLKVSAAALGTVGAWSAHRSIWITATRQAARLYRGTPQSISIAGIIVARDRYEGYLIALDSDQPNGDKFLS